MRNGVVERLRRAAIVCVFILGVAAVAATSPASTSIDITPASATLHIDPAHPAALTRIVVRFNAEATSGSPYSSVYVFVNSVRPADGSGDVSGTVEGVRLIVTTDTGGMAPVTIGSAAPDLDPVPTPWQAEVPLTSQVALPIDCAIGPCERAFWLIAQLSDPDMEAFDVDWRVGGSLTFSGSTWPSGAAATIELDTPIVLEGEVSQLGASTETEILTLGPTQPAAARVVAVSVGAAAIPEDGSPLGSVSVDLVRRRDSGGSVDRAPFVAIYPLDGPAAVPIGSDPPTPSVAPPDLDPFAGCQAGEPCIRHFLVTIAWTGEAADDESFDWRFNVRRVDLIRVWSTPADISARVETRFDVASDSKPSTVHLEGDADAVAFDDPPQVRLMLTTQTTATDPIAKLLPVPGSMVYGAQIIEPQPDESRGGANVSNVITSRNAQTGVRPIYGNFNAGDASLVAGPMAGCRVGDACPELTIATIVARRDQDSPLPTVRFHWSLDLTVYSYADVPVSLSVNDRSP